MGLHTIVYTVLICMSLKSQKNSCPQENRNTWFYYGISKVEQNKPIYFSCVGVFQH